MVWKTIDLGNGATCKVDGDNKCWLLNGEYHRTDGPAIDLAGGYRMWFINGVKYSEEEFDIAVQVLWAC